MVAWASSPRERVFFGLEDWLLSLNNAIDDRVCQG
jgi:hypothetical protein